MKKEYIIGLGNENALLIDDSIYSQIIPSNDGGFLLIECNINEKTMIVKERKGKRGEYANMILSDIKKNDTIDMGEKGETWEGDSLNANPFGYGCLYDNNNAKLFEGFMYDGKRVCYGTDYYPGGSDIEYCGTFFNGNRYGDGVLYDKHSSILCEGDYYNGNRMISIADHVNNDHEINSLIQELTIGNDCYSDHSLFTLIGFHSLRFVRIGDRCFPKVFHVIIRECEQLDSVVVGKGSFTKHPKLETFARCKSLNNSKDVSIVDCGSLKEIMIGALSFSDYCNMFELKCMNVMI